jgi:hypothetical protein
MDPNVIIESYVSDVVRRLPRRQRGDVGPELRSLLSEELAGRAAGLGRPADEPMTMDLLAAFGRPQDVADRYRPAGFTVIRPADAPRFAQVALGGVALQWAITLPAVFVDTSGAAGSVPGASDGWLTRLSAWWLSWGLGSFWWPGFLVSVTLVAALIRSRRAASTADDPDADTDTGTRTASTSVPRFVLDRDRINRPGRVLAIGFWALGASLLVALPWLPTLAPGLPQPLLDAFALDPDFQRSRAPWLLAVWAASFALELAVLVAGRTSRTTRRISVAIDACWLALLTWFLTAGRIFEAPPTDGVVRLCLFGTAALVVITLVTTIRRETLPTHAPTFHGVPPALPHGRR